MKRPLPDRYLTPVDLADLLGVPAGADDDFFTLGGDSVLVIRLAGRARRSGLPLKPQVVFAHRTPAAVAAALTADAAPHEPAPVAVGPLLPSAARSMRIRWPGSARPHAAAPLQREPGPASRRLSADIRPLRWSGTRSISTR